MPGSEDLQASTASEEPFPAGLVVLPGSAPRYAGPQGRDGDITEVLISSHQTAGAVGLFRQFIEPGSGPALHLHRTADEFFIIESGTFTFRIGERTQHIPPGSVLFVPRGTAHAFRNTGPEPGVLLVGFVPGGPEQMLVERVGVDAATSQDLMERYGTEIVGPPLA